MLDDRVDHDLLFKELLKTFFHEFIELFLPEVATYLRPDPPEFLDKEIFNNLTAGERKEVDLLAKVRFRDEEAFFLIHVENQASAQAQFARRMFRYFARLHEKFDLPIYPIAVLSYDVPQRLEPDSYAVAFPDRTVLQFSFRVIQLNQLHWREYIRQPNPVAAALMTKMQIAVEDRPKVKLQCMRMIATLKLNPARSSLIQEFMDRYLSLNSAEVEVYDTELQAVTPPEREAVVRVRNDFEAYGAHKTLVKIVIRQLRHRFGSTPNDLPDRLKLLSEDQLEELTDVLLDFTALAEVEGWLSGKA